MSNWGSGFRGEQRGKGTPSWKRGNNWRQTCDGIGKLMSQTNAHLASAADTLGKMGRQNNASTAFPPINAPPNQPINRNINAGSFPNVGSGGFPSAPAAPSSRGGIGRLTAPYRIGWWMQTDLLSRLEKAGLSCQDAGWKATFGIGFGIGLLLLAFVMNLHSYPPPAPYIAVGIGILLGFILPSLLGFSLRGTFYLAAFMLLVLTYALTFGALGFLVYIGIHAAKG